MKNIIALVAVIGLVVAFSIWSNNRTASADAAYAEYEACVRAEYGTTPAAYYEEHGETPVCG